MIWDKKPEKQILKAWEIFVDEEKRKKPDFKEAIQTAVSNISGTGTQSIQMRKIVCRKLGAK